VEDDVTKRRSVARRQYGLIPVRRVRAAVRPSLRLGPPKDVTGRRFSGRGRGEDRDRRLRWGGFVEAVAVVAGPGVGTGEGWWGGETSGVAGRSGAGRSGAILL
jgi:hypothetical protein